MASVKIKQIDPFGSFLWYACDLWRNNPEGVDYRGWFKAAFSLKTTLEINGYYSKEQRFNFE